MRQMKAIKPLSKTAQARLLLATGRFDHMTIADAAREMGLGYGIVWRAWVKSKAVGLRRRKSVTP